MERERGRGERGEEETKMRGREATQGSHRRQQSAAGTQHKKHWKQLIKGVGG